MRGMRLAACAVVCLFAFCGIGAGDSDATNAALKQVTRATKGT